MADRTVSAGAPATFGQKSIHRAIARWPARRLPAANVRRIWPVPPGTPTDSVVAALAELERRHDALRTGFVLDDDGEVRQVPLTADQHPPATVDLEHTGYADVAGVTVDLSREAFALERERPWRRVVVTSAGAPVGVAVVVHHIAADGWAGNVLHRDFRALLTGEPLAAGPPTCQQVAHRQWSPAWQPRRAAAAGHWRTVLAGAPPPVDPPNDVTSARVTTVRSTRMLSAATRIAARADATVHSVLLAAYCAEIAGETDAADIVVGLISGNRGTPGWREVVSSFTQLVPVAVRVDDGEDLGSFTGRVHRDALNAYRHGCYDVDMRTRVAAEHGRAGATIGLHHFYNYSPVVDQDLVVDDDDQLTVHEGPSAGYPTYLVAGDGHPSVLTLNESAPGGRSPSLIESVVERVTAAG